MSLFGHQSEYCINTSLFWLKVTVRNNLLHLELSHCMFQIYLFNEIKFHNFLSYLVLSKATNSTDHDSECISQEIK